MKVVLLGNTPPPYGGVSTHVRRLRARLRAAGHECDVWSADGAGGEADVRFGTPSAALSRLLELPVDTVFHAHAYHYLAGLLARRRRRMIFTLHNQVIDELLRGTGSLRRMASAWRTKRVFRHIEHFIAVSEGAVRSLRAAGIEPRAVDVINAYLPPQDDELADPENLRELRAFRERYPLLLTATAWRLREYNNEDLYGIDLCVDLMTRLRSAEHPVGLVLVLPTAGGSGYLAQLRKRALSQGVEDQILWLTRPGAYHPIIAQCDLFLRPTNTDGFSVSIAEALDVGVPVVASDAVPRPQGCSLFRSRDLASFTDQVLHALHHLPDLRAETSRCRQPDHFPRILEAYERVPAR